MLEQASKKRLENRIEVIRPVLDQGEFFADELAVASAERQCVINVMKQAGAIESVAYEPRVDIEECDDAIDYNPVHRWTWVNYRRHLREYVEEREELPCGCRTHVPPDRDGGQYICKFCGQGHSRDTIKEAL